MTPTGWKEALKELRKRVRAGREALPDLRWGLRQLREALPSGPTASAADEKRREQVLELLELADTAESTMAPESIARLLAALRAYLKSELDPKQGGAMNEAVRSFNRAYGLRDLDEAATGLGFDTDAYAPPTRTPTRTPRKPRRVQSAGKAWCVPPAPLRTLTTQRHATTTTKKRTWRKSGPAGAPKSHSRGAGGGRMATTARPSARGRKRSGA